MSQIDFDEVETSAKATPVASTEEEKEGVFEGWTLKRALIISIPCLVIIIGMVVFALS